MIFKFPQKKIVLDCFTSELSTMKTAPIDFAAKSMPQWWKNLPKNTIHENGFVPVPNMKHCVGMTDYFKFSVAIPLWSEIAVRVNKDKSFQWQFSNRRGECGEHNLSKQATGFFNQHGHMKLISPWAFKSEKNINWVWTQPTYSFPQNSEIVSLPAIVNYYYQHATNINYLFPLDRERTFFLEHGTPIALLTPMTDKKIKIVRHLVSKEEWLRINDTSTHITFLHKYSTRVKKINRLENCPYRKEV